MRTFWIITILILLGATAQAQTARAAFEKGARAANNGNYQRALRHYQKALAESLAKQDLPVDLLAKIHYNIGVCYFRSSQFAKAIEEYGFAINLSREKYQRAFRAMAMAHVELKDWQTAKTNFEKALLLDQSDGESWFDLAMVLLVEKDYERAAAAFRESIVYKSVGLPASHNNLGVILAMKNDFDAAEKEFEKALFESKNQFAAAKNNLEFCRSKRQNRHQDLLAKLEFSLKTVD